MGCAVDRILAAADRELTLDSLAIVFPRGERARAGSTGVRAVTSLARLRHAEESAQFAYVTAWRQHNEESELASVRARFRARLQNLDSLRACAVVGTLSVPARYRE